MDSFIIWTNDSLKWPMYTSLSTQELFYCPIHEICYPVVVIFKSPYPLYIYIYIYIYNLFIYLFIYTEIYAVSFKKSQCILKHSKRINKARLSLNLWYDGNYLVKQSGINLGIWKIFESVTHTILIMQAFEKLCSHKLIVSLYMYGLSAIYSLLSVDLKIPCSIYKG